MSSLCCRAFYQNGKPCTFRAKEGEFCGRHQNYLEKNPNAQLQEVKEVESKSRSTSSRKTSTKKRYTNEYLGRMMEAIINHFGIKLPEVVNKQDSSSSDEQEEEIPLIHKKKEVRRRAPVTQEVKPFSFIKESKLPPIFPIVQKPLPVVGKGDSSMYLYSVRGYSYG